MKIINTIYIFLQKSVSKNRIKYIKQNLKNLSQYLNNLTYIQHVKKYLSVIYNHNIRFFTSLFLCFFFWSWVLGIAIGIFGISIDIVRVADFYLKEGTQQKSDTYSFKVTPLSKKILNSNAISDLQNVEGIAFVDPYFTPNTDVLGSIDYFGFSASHKIQIIGIPKRLGEKKANKMFKYAWDAADLDNIPVLLPDQAITLYNNIAPQQGWPTLTKSAFVGFPGLKITINNQSYPAILSGFDSEEFGMVVVAPAQKLFALYENQNYHPTYSYIIVETISGLTKAQVKKISKEITKSGFKLSATSEDNLQKGIFLRIKYLAIIIGFSILMSFMFLYSRSVLNFLTPLHQTIYLYRIWGLKHPTAKFTLSLSCCFSIITGIIAWAVCFFVIIPSKKYIIDTLSQFGINTPSLRDSARTALEVGGLGILFFILLTIITLFQFYKSIPKENYLKKF